MSNYFMVTAYGILQVPADSVFVRAPKRKDGWWDMRTKLGREAQAEFIKVSERESER